MLERLQSLEIKLEARQKLQNLKNDMLVLKNIWFKKLRVRLVQCVSVHDWTVAACVTRGACASAVVTVRRYAMAQSRL